MTFEDFNLSKPLLNAISEQEISTPTAIQEEAIPVISSGKDVIGIAQTGTGKTLAYLIPILKSLKYSDQRQPRVMILVPTRELVVQVIQEIEKLTTYMSVRTLGVYGGTNINTQKQKIYEGCDILVATPGRLYDLVMTGILRLKSIQKLVIDECDEMLNLGFRPQLERILELLPTKRQNLMFSATMTEEVHALIESFFSNTQKIEISRVGKPIEGIEQAFYQVPNFNTKVNFLVHLLGDKENFKKVFVFVRSKKYADVIHAEMEKHYPNEFGAVHSNKSQNYRLRMIEEFQASDLRGIIATDVVSRGIDVDLVSHVINFDIPDIAEQYIHRIGRTGRQKEKGATISFLTESENANIDRIFELMGREYDILDLPSEVKVNDELIGDEEPINIHDAPTLKGKSFRYTVVKSSPGKLQQRSGKTPKKKAKKKRR
jgi:ATP-dependent RNA helicase RhlE